MSFPRYPKYKASGVEWLGEVPEHWDVKPVKHLATIVNGFPFDSALFDATDGVPLVRIRDLNQTETEARYVGPFVESAAVSASDVLIGMDGDFNVGRWRGTGPALLNQRMCCVRGQTAAITRLLEYLLPARLHAVNDITYATTVKHLASSQVEKIVVALPTAETEQMAIVSFLDRETAKIDALVAEQQRLMELLKEKRQAVISHAVTKGLNPEAPMKPSGVEWLGDVPAHWDVIPLKWSARICSGDGLQTDCVEDASDRDHPIPAIGGNGILGFTSGANVDRPVLAVGRVGALCGNVHVVRVPSWITDNALIVDVAATMFELEYLAHVVRVRDLNSIASKTAQPLITGSQLGDQRLPRPDVIEQDAIVRQVATAASMFDDLSEAVEKAVVVLRERRSALVSAAVTGQIDVRHLAPEAA